MWKVFFKEEKTNRIIKLPILYENPKLKSEFNTNTFKNVNGDYKTIVSEESLKEIEISSVFPNVLKGLGVSISLTPLAFIKTFKKHVGKKIRMIVVNDFGVPILNIMCILKSFEYSGRKNQDVLYTMNLLEYRDNNEYSKYSIDYETFKI